MVAENLITKQLVSYGVIANIFVSKVFQQAFVEESREECVSFARVFESHAVGLVDERHRQNLEATNSIKALCT